MVAAGHTIASICVSVSTLRAEPRHQSEIVSQLLMGDEVKVFDHGDTWHRVEGPDLYQGYCHKEHLTEPTDSYLRHNKAMLKEAFAFAQDLDGQSVFDVSMGCILGVGEEQSGKVRVYSPDLRSGLLSKDQLIPLPVASTTFDKPQAIQFAASLNGVPYLWGGTTPRGLDCSGLIQLCGRMQGFSFPRDAWQQANLGHRLTTWSLESLQPGDLLFMGEGERVTHVALYAGDSLYWHASGRVRQNSLDPKHPLYDSYRHRTIKYATRLP